MTRWADDTNALLEDGAPVDFLRPIFGSVSLELDGDRRTGARRRWSRGALRQTTRGLPRNHNRLTAVTPPPGQILNVELGRRGRLRASNDCSLAFR